ncbi:hypothetical protein ACOMHN_016851 [Nucella lapillus]
MGLTQGKLKAALTSQQKYGMCLPQKSYSPFPESVHVPGTDGLVLQIQALPSKIARGEISQDAFWWMDAQFLPYNDAEIVVTSTPYTLRRAHSWIPLKTAPHGRIILFNIQQIPTKGYVLTGTESSMYPKVQPHPLGEVVAYAGKGELKVAGLAGQEVYSQPRDLSNRSHRFCALSPGGARLAVLTHSTRAYYLETLAFGPMSLTLVGKPQDCQCLCPGFQASGTHNDHVECKWSPDGSRLAVSSSLGKLFVVCADLSSGVVLVSPQMMGDLLSTAGSFDFDPREKYSVMAVGSSGGVLTVCQICSGDGEILQQLDTGGRINCVQYSQDGSSVAVAFQAFTVAIHSTRDLTTLHTIDLSPLCSHHAALYQSQPYPTVQRLSFSYDGRRLVTSSCDGFVRVWSVPCLLTLQEWCRKTLLQSVPIVRVRKWSLPQKVKQFLLSEFF